jgi:hypothetical protein
VVLWITGIIILFVSQRYLKVNDMRSLFVSLLILVLAAGSFYFTKPSNQQCMEEAMKLVNADSYKVPGYSDPNNIETKSGADLFRNNLIIDDKILCKEISYAYLSRVKTIGYGYPGSFHKAELSK